jgi:DNA-nicking Smr family endonuclease
MEFPIEGTLDLHTFRPEDIKDLVPDYIQECRSRGILEVKIVHGKGSGTLMRIVHSILDGLPEVVSYAGAGRS